MLSWNRLSITHRSRILGVLSFATMSRSKERRRYLCAIHGHLCRDRAQFRLKHLADLSELDRLHQKTSNPLTDDDLREILAGLIPIVITGTRGQIV